MQKPYAAATDGGKTRPRLPRGKAAAFFASAAGASIVGVAAAAALTALKLTVGALAGSSAMISDGVHSGFDIICAGLAAAGVRLSRKKPDDRYQFGYGRFESVAAIILSMLLLFAAYTIGRSAAAELISGSYLTRGAPESAALIGTLIGLAVKFALYIYIRRVAAGTGSIALRSEARHHRTDIIASAGTLAGIAGARLGWLFADGAASLFVCVFIAMAAASIFRDAAPRVLDRGCGPEVGADIAALAAETPGCAGAERVKTRRSGGDIYAQLAIRVDGSLPLEDARAISREVRRRVLEARPELTACTVTFAEK